MTLSLPEKLLAAKNSKRILLQVTERLAFLAAELEAVKPIQKEYEELRAAVVALADRDYEADETVKIENEDVRIELSAKDVVRSVKNMRGLLEHLGTDMFFKHVRFPMSHLDVLVPKNVRSRFVSRKRNGARTCKVTLL